MGDRWLTSYYGGGYHRKETAETRADFGTDAEDCGYIKTGDDRTNKEA
ncbi:hypothetical protein [Fictibacillus terranigra]|nr:hypothetical protein [Fictibacillus sp. CENA-BCM004]